MRELSVRAAAADAGDRPALVFGDQTWTWSRLAAESDTGSDKPSGRTRPVVFEAPPLPSTVIRMLALIEAGVTMAPLHHGFTAVEKEEHLEALSRHRPARDALAVLFTSGSTGCPRPVSLSRAAFAASAAASADRLGHKAGDRWLACLPLAHVGGLSILVRSLVARTTIVLVPGFEPEAVRRAIDRHSISLVSLVPTMLRRLLDAGPHWRPPAGLRAVLLGGAPIPDALWDEATERGFPLRATYGLTETCSQAATGTPEAPRRLVPLAGVAIRIVDGLIEVRPPAANEFVRTGDLGRLRPDGSLEVTGRADDTIVTGGENVSPGGVEAALESHPGIRTAVVFGLADGEWGEIVAAALVPGAIPPPAEELERWCAERLAPFRRPRRIAWLDDAILSRTGKPDRRAMIDAARRMLAGESSQPC